jgi:ParB family chromosome partitioning protein
VADSPPVSRSALADARKRGLGRGLGVLLGRETFDDAVIRDLPIQDVRPSPLQPRTAIAEEDLVELTESIRDRGVLQPVLVRPVDEGFELVAGERRWRAALSAGLQFIPAVVRRLSNQEALEIALLENLQREDLSPLERARAYRRLQLEFGMTQEQIAQRLHKSQSSIANTVRLLQLPEEVQASLARGRISEGHARALLGVMDPETIRQLWQEVERRGLSVRQTEGLAKRRNISRGIKRRSAQAADPNLLALADTLSARFQTKVVIHSTKHQGRIVIEFYSLGDLDRILAVLTAQDQTGSSPTDI